MDDFQRIRLLEERLERAQVTVGWLQAEATILQAAGHQAGLSELQIFESERALAEAELEAVLAELEKLLEAIG